MPSPKDIDKSYNATIQRLAPWYQTINLNDQLAIKGHGGCGDPAWPFIKDFLKPLHGKRILDLGCNAGIHSIRAAQDGAKEVIGIEAQDQYIDQAKFIKKCLGPDLPVRYIQAYVEDLDQLHLGKFDSVLAISILYHIGKLKGERWNHESLVPETIKKIGELTDHVVVRVRQNELAKNYDKHFTANGFRLKTMHSLSRFFLEFVR